MLMLWWVHRGVDFGLHAIQRLIYVSAHSTAIARNAEPSTGVKAAPGRELVLILK